MNQVVLMGRLTKDPEIRNTGETQVARYTLAVDRRYKKEGETNADFIGCVAFGKSAEFAEKYFTKGMRIAISGRIQTGSYTNKDGVKVYTTDVIVENQEFAQSKSESQDQVPEPMPEPRQATMDDFMTIPEGLDEQLPFA